jgi:hypothetical protein
MPDAPENVSATWAGGELKLLIPERIPAREFYIGYGEKTLRTNLLC